MIGCVDLPPSLFVVLQRGIAPAEAAAKRRAARTSDIDPRPRPLPTDLTGSVAAPEARIRAAHTLLARSVLPGRLTRRRKLPPPAPELLELDKDPALRQLTPSLKQLLLRARRLPPPGSVEMLQTLSDMFTIENASRAMRVSMGSYDRAADLCCEPAHLAEEEARWIQRVAQNINTTQRETEGFEQNADNARRQRSEPDWQFEHIVVTPSPAPPAQRRAPSDADLNPAERAAMLLPADDIHKAPACPIHPIPPPPPPDRKPPASASSSSTSSATSVPSSSFSSSSTQTAAIAAGAAIAGISGRIAAARSTVPPAPALNAGPPDWNRLLERAELEREEARVGEFVPSSDDDNDDDGDIDLDDVPELVESFEPASHSRRPPSVGIHRYDGATRPTGYAPAPTAPARSPVVASATSAGSSTVAARNPAEPYAAAPPAAAAAAIPTRGAATVDGDGDPMHSGADNEAIGRLFSLASRSAANGGALSAAVPNGGPHPFGARDLGAVLRFMAAGSFTPDGSDLRPPIHTVASSGAASVIRQSRGVDEYRDPEFDADNGAGALGALLRTFDSASSPGRSQNVDRMWSMMERLFIGPDADAQRPLQTEAQATAFAAGAAASSPSIVRILAAAPSVPSVDAGPTGPPTL